MGQAYTGNGAQAETLRANSRMMRAPRGAALNCRNWPQEAALRMLMNSLDPDVAEQPGDLIACGATGKVLRSWETYDKTAEALKTLKDDETLLIQSGGPVGVFQTSRDAARVIITNTDPPGLQPTADELDRLEQHGLPIPGGTDPGSWTYVGTQSTLPTALQVFDGIGQRYFSGDIAGKLVVSGGMGAAGGALPLATRLLGAAFLGIDVDGDHIRRRIRTGYCDYCVSTLDEALRILKNAVRQKQAVSVGLVGNCADVIPELASRGVLPDILTDQTSAHDLLIGYVPSGLNADQAGALRRDNPEQYLSRCRESVSRHFNGMLALQKLGSVVFEFGNNLCAAAERCGVEGAASAFPNSVGAYLQPLLDDGAAPVRWVALSGEQRDIHRLDELVLELFSDDALLSQWIPLARKYVRSQGLPARVCWMNETARITIAERVNRTVADGAFQAPFVITFEQAETNLVTSPQITPDAMKDGLDGSVLNALLNACSEASWASLKCGAGYNRATVALVADGTAAAAKALPRVLRNDYARRILRLAGSGREGTCNAVRRPELRAPKPRNP